MARRIIAVPARPKPNPLLCLLCLRRIPKMDIRDYLYEQFGYYQIPTPIRLCDQGPAICETCAYYGYDDPHGHWLSGPRRKEWTDYQPDHDPWAERGSVNPMEGYCPEMA